MDHGIDWLGDNEQHEELNQIVQGNKYGWPYIYADGKYNPQDQPPGGISMAEGADRAEFLDAIRGHVLANGQIVGTFRR